MRPDARGALREWQIDAASVERTPPGTMNETFFVTTSDGNLVLRRHRTKDVDRLRWERRVIEHVRCRGVAAPALIPAASGATTVQFEGELWSLFERVGGGHVGRDDLTVDQARAMGGALAEVHDALSNLPPARRPSTPGPMFRLRERSGSALGDDRSAGGGGAGGVRGPTMAGRLRILASARRRRSKAAT